MVFLAVSALQISKDSVAKLHLHPCSVAVSSALFIFAAVGLLVSVVWTFVIVLTVLRPRGARYTIPEKGRNLMWQEHVLLHESNGVYFSAVQAAAPELVLHNITDQIYELSHISREKMRALMKSRYSVAIGFCSWALLIGSGFLLGRL